MFTHPLNRISLSDSIYDERGSFCESLLNIFSMFNAFFSGANSTENMYGLKNFIDSQGISSSDIFLFTKENKIVLCYKLIPITNHTFCQRLVLANL